MPKFLIFEGIDGSGKTTLSQGLEKYCLSWGEEARLFQEPTRYPTGLKIRSFLKGEMDVSPEEELKLFIEDRKISLEKNILPSLDAGFHVILDRYYYSTAAYQWKSGHTAEYILSLNKKKGFPEPDWILYLDIDPVEALERIQKSRVGTERFETKKELEIIRKRYEEVLPPERTLRLDATLPSEEILKIIFRQIFSQKQ